MKKVFWFSATLCTGFLMATVFVGLLLSVRAGTEPQTASGNGDINGDSAIDISDAIALLTYIFRNGAPPVACADSPEIVGRVAALEDVTSTIASSLADIAAAITEGPVMSPEVEAAILELREVVVTEHEGPCAVQVDRYVDNLDGTVTDTCTELMWLQNELPWEERIMFREVPSFEPEPFAGYDDWRIPSVDEFVAFWRNNVGHVPTWSFPVDRVFGTITGNYWTSNVDENTNRAAFSPQLDEGIVNWHSPHQPTRDLQLLLVRG